jgi:hypothetical protein
MISTTKTSFAVLLGAAVIAAGCGGDDGPSIADVKKAYGPVDNSLKNLGEDIQGAVKNASGKTDAALATQFDDLAEKTDAQIQDVRGMEVTDDLADERDALADALVLVKGDLADISTAAEQSNVTAAANAARSLITHAKTVTEAKDALDGGLKKAES